jgi:hypothetical protein
VLKAKTTVILPLILLHYDPEHWPEPHCFNPDRFREVQTMRVVSALARIVRSFTFTVDQVGMLVVVLVMVVFCARPKHCSRLILACLFCLSARSH